MTKILVLGCTGMLGNTMFRYLSKNRNFIVFGTIRDKKDKKYFQKSLHKFLLHDIDAENLNNIENAIISFKPNYIINCIGIVKQLKISDDIKISTKINILFPLYLQEFSLKYNFKLIHFSTDCVFKGTRGNYSEKDITDAIDIYGRTKFLGEVNKKNSITLRVSIIGHELKSTQGLVDWFLSQKKCIQGYSSVIFSGLPTIILSEIIESIIINNPKLFGIYHISSKPISKYELLRLIGQIYDKNIYIKKSNKIKIDRSLNSTKIKRLLNLRLPSWDKMIKKMYNETLLNKNV